MSIDPELWQEMFTLDTIPMCPEGIQRAKIFLAVCGHAVKNATVVNHEVSILASWRNVSEHANTCRKCREI